MSTVYIYFLLLLSLPKTNYNFFYERMFIKFTNFKLIILA